MRYVAYILIFFSAWAATSPGDPLSTVFEQRKWDATAQLAFDLLRSDPNNAEAALRGSYALFQQGYPNAALILLRKVPPRAWNTMPPKLKRFAEVVAILQKKVPLTVLPGAVESLREQEVPSYLRDEVLYSKGRAAYARDDVARARHYLGKVQPRSRYYAQAHYLLAVLSVKEGDLKAAGRQISQMFENSLFRQSSEFWNDVTAEMSEAYGSSVRVFIGGELLNRATTLSELGRLAMARIKYAQKDYEGAMEHYEEVPESSLFGPRAKLETLWTLLQQGKHDEAGERARELSTDPSRFESVEARVVRSVVLADAKRLEEARQELFEFQEIYKQLNIAMEKFTKYGVSNALPEFTQRELAAEVRLRELGEYRKLLTDETARLRSSQARFFPVYGAMAIGLRELITETRALEKKIRQDYITLRLADLRALYVQSKLILAETYLEDREKLRQKFRSLSGQVTEAQQVEHDRQLVELLERATTEVSEVMPLMKARNPYLEFRHSEILWELGTARQILAQSEDRKKNMEAGERARVAALKFARGVRDDFPKFSKRAQVLFFVGFVQIELGRAREGLETLKRYVSTFPSHEHTPDAYRILGDTDFDNNNFKSALNHFLRILNFDDSPVIGYAFYKIAWCYYNGHQYGKSMLALEKAIQWANQSKNQGQLLSLKKEAKRDLISIYAEFGDARKALEYYQSFIGGEAYEWMEELARRYDEAGQYEKSNYIYNVLISMRGDSEKNLPHYAKILEGNFRLQDWEGVLKVAQEIVALHGESLKSPSEDKESPSYKAEESMRKVALGQHFEFGKDNSPEVTDRIVTLDRIYMGLFARWKTAQPLFYKHAFFLAKKDRSREAAATFKDHWELFKDHLEEPLKEEGLRNLVNSLAKVDEAVKEPGEGGAPQLNETAKDVMKYAALYFESYPKSKHARTLAFLRATTLLKYKQTDAGIEATQKIFDANPTDDFGKKAFKNLTVAYYETKDWTRVYEWADRMLSLNDGRLRAFEEQLVTVREEALFLAASEAKDKARAGELFLKVVNESKGGRLKEKSLYNAILNFQKRDERLKVIELAQRLEKDFPKSQYLPVVSGIQAALFQEAGDYGRALPLLVRFLKGAKEIKAEGRAQAILNVAFMTQAMGNAKAARALFHQLLSLKEGAGEAAKKQASAALAYLDGAAARTPAAVLKGWADYERTKKRFLSQPIPKKGGLAARIKKGARDLQANAEKFLAVANDNKAPNFNAFEAFCAVPLFYRAYAMGVLDLELALPEKARAGVRAQLTKVAQPLIAKSNQMAMECLEKSRSAEHDGPWFREVNRDWGWESDPELSRKVQGVIALLKQGQPWVAPAPMEVKGVIEKHLKKEGSADSWYALAVSRLKNKPLARLTLIDALARASAEPPPPNDQDTPAQTPSKKGRVLAALAAIEQTKRGLKSVLPLYRRALEEGALFPHANFALYHLSEGRLEKGRQALKQALDAGIFAASPKLRDGAKELLQK